MSTFDVPSVTSGGSPAGGGFFSSGTPPTGSGGFWSPSEHLGDLHLVIGGGQPVRTVDVGYGSGRDDAAFASAIVVFKSEGVEVYRDQNVSQKRLRSQISSQSSFIGRLIQGQASKGKNAPWVFGDASVEDVTTANAWVSENCDTLSNGTLSLKGSLGPESI